jgi:ATP-dependent RNA helicase DDX3X
MLLETKQDIPDFLQQYIPEGYQEGNDLRFEVDSDDGDANAAGFGEFGGTGVGAGDGSGGGAGWDAPTQPTPTPAAATAAWNAFGDSQPEIKTPALEVKVVPNTVKAVPFIAGSAKVGGWGEPGPVAPTAAPVLKAVPAASAAKVATVTKAAPVAAASASGWGVSNDNGWGTGGGESSW